MLKMYIKKNLKIAKTLLKTTNKYKNLELNLENISS